MPLSFSELLALVPKAKRGDKASVVAALYALDALEVTTSRTTKDVADLLALHLKGKAPANVSDVLAKAAPEVDPVNGEGRQKQWHLTSGGVTWFRSLTGERLPPAASTGFAYQLADLQAGVRRAAEDLFLSRHYTEAVGRAAKWLNWAVRQQAGRLRDDGVPMMHQVFAVEPGRTTRLVLGELREDWERDRQDGLRSLFAGMQAAILNVDKHGDLGIIDPASAMEHLCLLSVLAKQLERCRRVEPAA